jgi:hypothetical protein
MNFKYYFPALVLTGVFLLSSCEHHSDPSDPDNPSTRHISRPDSVYVYDAAYHDTITPHFIDHYQYDANGNRLSHLSYYVEKQQYTAKEERTYDSRNNLLEIRNYSYDETLKEWDCWRTDRQTYDSNGKLATHETEHKGGNDKKKALYSWLDNTHATTDVYAYHYMGDTTEWKLVDKAEYIYNADGNITYEKYIFSYYTSESARDKPIEYFFEYDRYGNCSSYKDVSYGKLWQYDTYAYSYDSDGNILVKRTYSNLSGEPVLQTKEVYFY